MKPREYILPKRFWTEEEKKLEETDTLLEKLKHELYLTFSDDPKVKNILHREMSDGQHPTILRQKNINTILEKLESTLGTKEYTLFLSSQLDKQEQDWLEKFLTEIKNKSRREIFAEEIKNPINNSPPIKHSPRYGTKGDGPAFRIKDKDK